MRLLLALCLVSAVIKPSESDMCIRHVAYHYVCHDNYDLGYLDRLYNITETLLKEGSISSTRADIMKRTLQYSSHTLCVPGKAPSRQKRQLVSGAIGLVSGLIIPFIFNMLIYPSGDSAVLSRFHDFALRTRGIARANEHKIYQLENRINRLARKEDMNALFDNIIQSLQLEEQKFSELISNGVHFSTSLYTMLKPAINRYHKAGIIDPNGRHSLSNSPLIPETAIHLNISTNADPDCNSALVNITAYTPIPSLECEEISVMTDSYTVTKVKDSEDCRIVAPLRGLIWLPDGRSYLSPSNHYLAPNCAIDNFTFSYSDNRKTIFALPKLKGGMVATCGGGVHRDVIEEAVGIAPSPSCSAYLSSGHIAPGVKDLYHPGTWLLNSQGSFLDSGTIPSPSYAFIEHATESSTARSTTEPAPGTDDLEPPSASFMTTTVLCVTGSIVTIIFVSLVFFCLWKCGAFNHKAIYEPAEERVGKLRVEDIQVVDRPNPADELTIARLEKIGSDLKKAGKPEYGVKLLSMRSLAMSRSTNEMSSRSTSFSDDYEAPIELAPIPAP